MKRRPPKPDLRPDWRDPAMPIMRDYKMANGERKTIVDADYEHRYREHMMNAAPHPDWRNDPTYNLRKDRK
jgi:hypothetical protein